MNKKSFSCNEWIQYLKDQFDIFVKLKRLNTAYTSPIEKRITVKYNL